MLLPTTKTVKFESHDLCIALQPKLMKIQRYAIYNALPEYLIHEIQ